MNNITFNPPSILPEEYQPILIKYKKGKSSSRSETGIFLIQGYISKHDHDYYHKGCETYICWSDYANRLLVTIPSDSKNEILGWSYINEDYNFLEGKSLKEAKKYIKNTKIYLCGVKVDGMDRFITMNLDFNRLQIEINNGIITKVHGLG